MKGSNRASKLKAIDSTYYSSQEAEGRRAGQSMEAKSFKAFDFVMWNGHCIINRIPDEANMKKRLRRNKVAFRSFNNEP